MSKVKITQDTESWEDIDGYEGIYQISNKGRVKCLPKDVITTEYGHIRHYPERIAKNYTRNGYKYVELSKSSQAKKHSIHRLVATAFVPNQNNKPQVNHIDGDKTNNKPSNLEWVTVSENIQHAYDIGLKNPPNGNDHWSRRDPQKVFSVVDEQSFVRAQELLKKGISRKEIAKKLKISKTTMARIARNEIKKFKHLA